ncbi:MULTISPECIES: hypothetical protein [unclassified Methylobacterium]|jgi:hypothetical protein|uniref:hypothetical protein n=1 Tax=unclassified Methylobacterium TaxID=2615210 RepID=UPI0013551B3E|nr:hypothetical protein [Methylobacterium sp. 2A]MWV24014.1 hypothetical protein [Methylobacterium sp. 2A]
MMRYGRFRACAALLPLALAMGRAAAQAPGDALNADEATGAVKVCSPVAMPRWRSMTPVPKTWTYTDCMAFSGEMGATHFQLGCLFTNVTPYAQKYAWGALVQIETSALAKAQPPVPNCGW